ncbi:MAG: hypothetical protein M1836_002213 [Candelina mexicana]|nr:MAG: hypothetical protein M1836_002213 [Candelina mexicana]
MRTMRWIVNRVSISQHHLEVPTELLIEIFKYLPRKDIKSTRLVCKEFQYASSQFLIDRVYLSGQTKQIEALTAVSRHPIFRNYVREIVYDAAHFDKRLTDRRVYEQVLWRGQTSYDESLKAAPLSDGLRSLNRGWEQYKSCFEEQERVLRTDEDIRCLNEALPHMPNVYLYTITDDAWGGSGNSIHSNQDRRYSIPLPPDFEMTMLKPSHWPCVDDLVPSDHSPLWYRGFEVFCRVACLDIGKKIRSLRIDPANSRSGISHHALNLPPEELDRAKLAFEALTSLELCINTHNVEEDWVTTMRTGTISELSSAARNLEKLWLRFDARCRWLMGDFPKVTGSQRWPKLRSVALCLMDMHERELVEFLCRHVPTIEVLDLQYVEISEGTWNTVLEEIRQEMKRWPLVLKEIPHFMVLDRIQDNLDEHLNEDVFRFLRYGGQNPFRATRDG